MYNEKKTVVFVIAHKNFRDEEYFEPKGVLEGAGWKVITASTYLTPAMGKLGGEASVDVIFSEVDVNDYDAIVFIGGPGIVTLWDDWRTQGLAKLFAENNKLLAAICSAPVILAKAELLNGKKATCFPDDQNYLTKAGATYTGDNITWDESGVLTANGPKAAKEFGTALLMVLETGTYAG